MATRKTIVEATSQIIGQKEINLTLPDDRGPLDLTRRIEELEEALDGYVQLVRMQKNEIWGLKQISSENEINKNLLHGYKKVIEDLSIKLRKAGK